MSSPLLDATPTPLTRGSVSVFSDTKALVRKLYRSHYLGVPIDLWVELTYDYDATYDPTDAAWLNAVTNAYAAAGYAVP